MPKAVRDQVFVSYSHKDKKWFDELLTHLKPYLREGSITAWSDQQIEPGSRWFDAIQRALVRTKVAVLLVTPNFLESSFIHEHELAPLLEAATNDDVTILWVPVRACSHAQSPIQRFQPLIDPKKPLARMRQTRDKAWVTICKAIKDAAGQLRVVGTDRRIVRDLERAIERGQLEMSSTAQAVLDAFKRATDIEPAGAYDPIVLTTGIRAGHMYFVSVKKSAGMPGWQNDFAVVATPILVAVARSLDPCAEAQALLLRLCDELAAQLQLRLMWPADANEANDLRNALYMACLEATELESDDVLLELRRLPVVGPP